MKPGFMRFPGGCIVEGNDLPNAYRWKDTVGDVSVRKQNWNRWTQDDPNRPDHHYHQTYGLGFFEFFQLCEDIGAAPVPVLNCGMSCQFQAKQLVPLERTRSMGAGRDRPDRVRQRPGHLEVGETPRRDGPPGTLRHEDTSASATNNGASEYFERYEVFYKALKADASGDHAHHHRRSRRG